MREIRTDVDAWVHGDCFAASLAMHRATGWEIGGLTLIRLFSRGVQMAHSWVTDPEGRHWDAAGIVDMEEIRRTFLSHEPPHVVETARIERYPDGAAFMERHLQLAIGAEPECLAFFQSKEEPARLMVEDILLPRYAYLAQAVRGRSFPDFFPGV